MSPGKYTSSSVNHFYAIGEYFIKGLPFAGFVHIMACPQASQHVDRVSFRYCLCKKAPAFPQVLLYARISPSEDAITSEAGLFADFHITVPFLESDRHNSSNNGTTYRHLRFQQGHILDTHPYCQTFLLRQKEVLLH